MMKYEMIAPGSGNGREFDDEAEARRSGEDCGEGATLIAWFTEPNPLAHLGALPAIVYRSCRMEVILDGKWQRINIFGG